MKRNVWLKISMVLATMPTMAFATGLSKSFTFDGVLKDNTNAPITTSTPVEFQILDPTASCVLYEELQTITPVSDGSFITQVGSDVGSAKRTAAGADPGNAWHTIFQNSTSMSAPGCPGSIYSPATGHARKLRVIVNGTPLTPDFDLHATPTATVAETLQGKGANEFLMVKDDTPTDLSQTNLETAFSSTNWPKLQNLLSSANNGGMVGVPTSSVNFGNQLLTNVAAPSGALDATNKNYVDSKIGGSTLDLAGLADGKVLKWDAANTKWVASTPSATDVSKLPLAGGTMTGALNMGSQNISNVGNLTIVPQGSLRLGQFTAAEEATFISSVLTPGGAGYKGTTWYETTNNKARVWNGSAAVDVGGSGGAGDFMANGTLPMTGQLLAKTGPGGAPGLTFAGDSDTGIYSATADRMGLVTGGLDRLHIDPTGHVGIGTTTPLGGAILDINGTNNTNSSVLVPRADTANRPTGQNGMIRYNTSLNKFEAYENGVWTNMIAGGGGGFMADGTIPMTGSFRATDGNVFGPGITFDLDPDTGIYRNGADIMSFATGGAERVRIDQAGQVKIGGGTPSRMLDVGGAIHLMPVAVPAAPSAGDMFFDSGDSNKLKYFDGSSWNTVGSGSGTVTNISTGTGLAGGPITGSGTISIAAGGVGTTEITNNAITGSKISPAAITSAHIATGTVALANGNNDASPLSIGTNDNFPMIFETNGAEKMRIDGSGKVGIGIMAPMVDLHVSNPAGGRIMVDGPSASSGAAKAGVMITNYANAYANSGSHPTLWLRNARGTNGAPGNTMTNDYLGSIMAEGYFGGFMGGASMNFLAKQSFSSGMAGTAITFKTVKNNTSTPFEAMRIDDSGFVGIGTTFPSAPMDVEAAGAQQVVMRAAAMGATRAQLLFEDMGTSMPVKIGSLNGDGFAINVNNTDQVVVTPTGNVGIGTNSPMAKLVVNGTILGKEQVVPTGSGVDFSVANTFILQSVGGSTITIVNPNPGGKYTIIVEDTTPRTYTISGCSNAYYSPANATTSQRSVYNIHYVNGNNCYIDWKTGYQ